MRERMLPEMERYPALLRGIGGEVQGLPVRTRCLHGTLRREFLNHVTPFVSVTDATVWPVVN